MGRGEFVLVFCGTWLVITAVKIWLGFDVSVDRLVTGLTLAPFFAFFMPDREDG